LSGACMGDSRRPGWAAWAVAFVIACQTIHETKAQKLYPPCDAPSRTIPGKPKCEGVYPSTVTWRGGEKVIMALSNLNIPWYVKSGHDPCPWSHDEWRELHKVGVPGFSEPMAVPKISLISIAAGTVTVGQYQETPLKVFNRTVDHVDFRDYMFLEPEGNSELLHRHKDHVLISFTVPASPSARPSTFDLYIDYDGIYTSLSSRDFCQVYMHDDPPKMSDVYPEMASAQGGTTITVFGSFYVGWPRQPTIAKFVDPHGQELVVPQKFIDPLRIEYDAPPYVLNETDISVNLTMYISLSWQTWFKVQLNNDTTIPIVYYDHSRVTCGQTVTLENILGRMSTPKVLSVSNYMQHHDQKRQTVAAINRRPDDHGIFWTIKEAHGEKPCTPGQPVLCNQTIRLTSLSTGLNLHSSWADAPSGLRSGRKRLVSARGHAAHGDAGDDWLIRCEPNTIHPYHQSLYDKTVDQSDTGEYTVENYTWSHFTYNMALHKARFKWILSQNDKYWRHSTVFSLLHVGTQRYMSFEEEMFSNPLCGQDPQTAISYRHVHGEQYQAQEEIECNDDHQGVVTTVKHIYNQGEPTGRTNIRFYLGSATDMPVDCDRGVGGFRTRYSRWSRRLAETDFVVWSNSSGSVCDNQGPLTNGWHCESCNYIVGQVHQVLHEGHSAVVEIWTPRFPRINAFTLMELPQFQQTLERRNITLLLKDVSGPLVHKMDGNSLGPKYPIPDPTPLTYWSNSRINFDPLAEYFFEYRRYVRLRLERVLEQSESYQDANFADRFMHEVRP